MTRVAAIDCGTNTIRLLIAEADRDDEEQRGDDLQVGRCSVQPGPAVVGQRVVVRSGHLSRGGARDAARAT